MKILPLLVLIFHQTLSLAQNIVPNYSFEVSDSCPHKINYITHYGSGYNLGCKHWAQTTRATPDYFHECDLIIPSGETKPRVGIPANNFGRQNAFDGQAYAGGIMYQNLNYREYLMSKIPPLEVDTPYEVTIFVSLADESRWAVNGFGGLFTTYGSPDTITQKNLPSIPQVDYTSYGIISDTINWVKLTKIFVPDSAYQYMIIGVFKSDADIDTLRILGVKTTPNYYYFDNIIVRKLSSAMDLAIEQSFETTLQPNPVRSILSVTSPVTINHVSIYNMVGSSVYDVRHDSKHLLISVADLPQGIYTIRINDVLMKQFIKQ